MSRLAPLVALILALGLGLPASGQPGRPRGIGHPPRSGGPLPVPAFGAEKDFVSIRMEPGQGRRESDGWITTLAEAFVRVPRMSASFVAAEPDTNVVATFSAEAYSTVAEKRLFVRALVDGAPASPADVVFTEGTFKGARSFEFTHVVGAGIHTVEIEWRIDSGARAYLRGASLKIRQGKTVSDAGTLTFLTPESGPNETTTVPAWTPIPDADLPFYVPPEGEAIVSFSAETHVSENDSNLWVRALVDGAPCMPGDVVFADRSARRTHLMCFKTNTLAPGWHTASMQWQVTSGAVGTLGDRTLAVSVRKTAGDATHRLVVAAGGQPVATSDTDWTTLPGLSSLVFVPDNGEVVVTFAGEVQANATTDLFLRLRVGNFVSDVEQIVIGSGGVDFETQSFAFDRKHVFARSGGGGLYGVNFEWKVSSGGNASMADRVMEVLVEPGPIPDLAEAPEFGLGSSDFPNGSPVEAAIGKRNLLAIIHRIDRDAPNHVIPSVAATSAALFGPHGMSDYFLAMSGDRFTFENAGVLAYDAMKSEDHYWNHAPFSCGGVAEDGFTGGHSERWAESILLADDDVNFASYDRDKNGVLEPHELTILVVAPQAVTFGTMRALDPYCDGTPFVVDGVEVQLVCEWFTSNPAADVSTAAHEICHLTLGLGDMYVNDLFIDTEPRGLSLMGENYLTTTHLDALHKLALGWATPGTIKNDGFVDLADVKTSETVLVLPRRNGGDGREYFLLETRRSANPGDPNFDEAHDAHGVALWHVIEDPVQSAAVPLCQDPGDWASVTGNARRGIRLVRPQILLGLNSKAVWNDQHYDVTDGGEVCPGGGVDPTDRRNALVWADGTPSGYGISQWSAPGATMTFFVSVP